MKTQELNNKVIVRAKELLTIPQVQKEYQSKENEAEAKDWILHQALITFSVWKVADLSTEGSK